MKTLIGSTLPMSLIRRQVRITPCELDFFKEFVGDGPVCSFWGHQNTIKAVSEFTGLDLTPKTERPALVLDSNGFPTLDGEWFGQAFVVTPLYKPGFRPKIGEEVSLEDIEGWNILHVQWENN